MSLGARRPHGGGPLSSVRVLELAGIGPCPFTGMLLADLGAEVLRVERNSAVAPLESAAASGDVLQRGKRSIGVDLKAPEGVALVLTLVERADALIEGFRPGVTERLGLGPQACFERNRKLVYGRMTGWGQEGPLAGHPGHDIDYISIAGVLGSIGRAGERPLPPLNLVGDFGGGGMLLALGVMAGLLAVAGGAEGQVVDAAMVDGSALLTCMIWGLRALGMWEESRGTNMLDTGAPFYDTYECSDGRHVAVGAIEPRFYAALCRLTGLGAEALPAQMDRSAWPQLKERFAAVFATKTRDEWVGLAADSGGDACLAPVLTMSEALEHPHNVARDTFVSVGGVDQPAPAPRFSGTPARAVSPPCRPGEKGLAALSDWGLEDAKVAGLVEKGVLRAR